MLKMFQLTDIGPEDAFGNSHWQIVVGYVPGVSRSIFMHL
jgi:hypothetical protein